MADESFSTSHLSVAMTTDDADTSQTTSGNMITLLYKSDQNVYLRCAVLVMGMVGTAGNALILYALVASKQHKKHPLIVNQNALDFACSFFLVVCNVVELFSIGFDGTLGYWLCLLIRSELLVNYLMYGSRINIAAITVERYLKVVHPVWSKKRLRSWMIRSTMVFCWLIGFVNVSWMVVVRKIKNGVCYMVWSKEGMMAALLWIILSFYVIILAIFIFCYSRILVAIRRQARVMAGHSAAGPSTAAQTQSKQIKTNVIKTMITDNTVRQISISQGSVATQYSAATSVIKTMILVSAFYVICHLPKAVQFNCLLFGVDALLLNTYFTDAALLAQHLYVTTNPFIYAVKFDPVKKVLKDLILRCVPGSNLVQPQAGTSFTGLSSNHPTNARQETGV